MWNCIIWLQYLHMHIYYYTYIYKLNYIHIIYIYLYYCKLDNLGSCWIYYDLLYTSFLRQKNISCESCPTFSFSDFSDFSDFSVYSVCFFIISGHFGFGILQIAEDHLLGAQISRCRQAHEAQPSAQLQAPGARQVVVALRQGTGHGQTGGPKLPRQVTEKRWGKDLPV